MVKVYLNALKTKGNYTYADISNLSGIPEATIRKIFSGETADPRFETIQKLVTSMGGSMDKILAEDDNKPDIEQIGKLEADVIKAVKDIYENRVADLKEHTDRRLDDKMEIIENQNEHIKTLKKELFLSKIFTCIGFGILIVLLILEVANPDLGWIKF